MRIFIANIDFELSQDQLREPFERIGVIQAFIFPVHRETGRPKGFAFIDMKDVDARRAIEQLNGALIGRRRLDVKESEPRDRKPRDERDRGSGTRISSSW